MVNSKNKGNSNEYKVAKILTEWSKLKFHHLPASGALRWNEMVWTFGDLLPPESLPIIVECKWWKEVSVEEILGTSQSCPATGKIVDWWSQVNKDTTRCKEAIDVSVEPVLIWRHDYGQFRICVREEFMMGFPSEVLSNLKFITSHFGSHPEFSMTDLKHFLSEVNFIQFSENLLKFL